MKKQILLLIMMAVLCPAVLAQKTNKAKVRLADKKFDAYSYLEAIPIYEDVLSNGSGDAKVMSRLADCYRLTGNSEKAEHWYAKLIVLSGMPEPIHYYYYAQMLQENRKYAEAQKFYIKFSELNALDTRGKKKKSGPVDFTEVYTDSAYVTFKTTNLNTTYDEFGVLPYRNDYYFLTSNRANKLYMKRIYNRDLKPYLDVYLVKRNSDGTFEEPQLLSKKINTKYHEGPVTFFPQFNIIYLTRNNYFEGKVAKSREGINKLKIYIAFFEDNSWSNAKQFEYNNNEYSVGHPSITRDGTRLYFTSDMAGGYGGTDIYLCRWDGVKWGIPENLGPRINTEGNEMFPYIADDSLLYFSSDGFNGFGGLDVYVADYSMGDTVEVKNMGFPINSNKDDFSFIIDTNTRTGYLSSNRPNGMGGDDVYTFKITRPKNPNLVVKVVDRSSGRPIADATVTLFNTKKTKTTILQTDTAGKVYQKIYWDHLYRIHAAKDRYTPDSTEYTCKYDGKKTYFVELRIDKKNFMLEGIVYNKATKAPIPGAKVILRNQRNEPIDSMTATEKGFYSFPVAENSDYILFGKKEKYFVNDTNLTTKNKEPGLIVQDLPLEEIILNKAIRIDNIYYDLAKWNIRPDAAVELDKIVKLLKDNPTIEIELSSHTDSRGGDQYNMTLSDKRAKSAAEYIVSQGIDPKRIVGKGYGETMLLNRCKNGVKCSEPEHQLNRRTEFKVTKF